MLNTLVSPNNSDWADLYQNLKKTHRSWGMVLGVLVKAGATVRAREMFYKSVVHAVLMYRVEIWVIMDVMMKFL